MEQTVILNMLEELDSRYTCPHALANQYLSRLDSLRDRAERAGYRIDVRGASPVIFNGMRSWSVDLNGNSFQHDVAALDFIVTHLL